MRLPSSLALPMLMPPPLLRPSHHRRQRAAAATTVTTIICAEPPRQHPEPPSARFPFFHFCVSGGGSQIRLAFEGGRDLIRGSTLGISPDGTGARISEHLACGKILVAPSELIGGRSMMRKHRRGCRADAAKPVMCRDLIPARMGRSLGY